ncbi:S1C family serine protease [Bullifex porci]|uniref:S1C family serine protease n=1 Tax=Bullifex porci TaxID=2606638 RepID=UPI0023F10C5E|nr:trypsin-like peptidase domain-containing protein [Bullifex porci]MDD7255056.1 trypsin-like peptidase domain-containing protein [Bullifex porci]MDY2741529.1 trypsin-like peptidase domain-containing protein [Bullifex porci]
MNRKNISRIVLVCALLIAIVTILSLLLFWTSKLNEEKKIDELRRELSKVASKGGEEALLSLAGVPLKGIFYTEDGVVLFEDDSSWSYSLEEKENMRAFDKAKASVIEIVQDKSLSSSISGCGVIISSEGYAVTNGHVVGSGKDISVNLYDGTSVDATLVGVDSLTDIAVIKLEKIDRKYVPLEMYSGQLNIGQKAIAIGSPYGYSWSMSVGVVSGLSRLVYTSSMLPLTNMIQTDAAINPGNSGGPLLNSRGEMIGLNTAIYSTSGENQGLSFALPLETVLDVATSLIKSGSVNRGWLDVLAVELNSQIAEYLKLDFDQGVLISQVVPSGGADRAGLKGGSEKVQYGQSIIYLGGDIITEIDGKSITGYSDYIAVLGSHKSEDKVDIKVYRNGNTLLIKDVVLTMRSEENSRWIIR